MKLSVLNLGRCDYEKALNIQYDILEKRQRGEIEDTLILVEHPPVITSGRNAIQSNIVASQEYLKNQGVDFFETNRGGDVTYHGYGQIVGYPVFDLRSRNMSVREFVGNLETTFINLLNEEYQINGEKDPRHTGVWVGSDKILAIGLAVKRRITMHGFAFNVNTNLEHFKLIVPCGISDKGVTSIEKLLGHPVEISNANESVLKHFCKTFGYTDYQDTNKVPGI